MRLRLFCVAWSLAALASAAQGEVRKWTDKAGGYSVQAEFVEVAGDHVVLKREDGKNLRIPLEKLSATDQEFVRQKTTAKPDNPFAVPVEPSSSPSKPNQEANPGEGTSEDAGTLREVLATGQGTSEEEAKRNAFHNAVEQAVGVYVDATTIVNNEKLIEDSVLTYSNAYVKSFTVIRSSATNGIQTVKIKAMVKVQRLAEKLRSQGIKTISVDGQSLAAEIVTTKRMEEDGAALLKKAIGDFPLQFVEFTPSGELTRNAEGGVDAVVRYSVNKDAYRKYVTSLETVLKQQASQSGTGTIPFNRGEFRLDPEGMPEPSQKLFGEIDDAKERGDRFLLILGKSVLIAQEDGKPTRHLVVDWYVLKDSVRPVLLRTWKRSFDILLRCELQDDVGQTIAEVPRRPCHAVHSDRDFVHLLPGHPVFGARNRVLVADCRPPFDIDKASAIGEVLILPMLSVLRYPNIEDWKEVVDIRLHFNASADEVARVKRLVVKPELPPVEKPETSSERAKE